MIDFGVVTRKDYALRRIGKLNVQLDEALVVRETAATSAEKERATRKVRSCKNSIRRWEKVIKGELP
jgi:hypothetical protein